jgi:ABC-type glutathione transport system ATPase component
MAALLDVRDLSVRFPSAEPVKGVSFTANPGEMLAIVASLHFDRHADAKSDRP